MLTNFLSTIQAQPDPPEHQDNHSTTQEQEPLAPPAPDPPEDQPTVITQSDQASSIVPDEQPKPQRRSNRRKKIVSYQI